MAEYNSDEERLTAIMDFLKRNQRTILLIFSAVFFTAITSVTVNSCLLYTSPSPRDRQKSRMPSSA